MPMYTVRFMPFSDVGERVFTETKEVFSANIMGACEFAIAYGSDDLFRGHGDRAEWLVTVFVTPKYDGTNRRYLTFDPLNPPTASAFKKWETQE